MPRPRATVEELSRLLPEIPELESLRLSILGRATFDPERAWEKSREHATVDKRVVELSEMRDLLADAQRAQLRHLAAQTAVLEPLFEAYRVGDMPAVVRQLVRLGELKEGEMLLRSARRCYEAALQHSLALSEKGPQILALRRVARAARACGELEDAGAYYQRSAALALDAQRLGDAVVALTGLGNVLAEQGWWGRAEAEYERALSHLASAGDGEDFRLEAAQVHNNLGLVMARQARYEEAEQWLARAMETWDQLDSPVDCAVCLHNQVRLHEQRGEMEAAVRVAQRALALDVPPQVRAVIAIDAAQILAGMGRVREAERWGREAEQCALSARSPYYLGHMYLGLGNIARIREQADGFVFFEKSLDLARSHELPFLEGMTLVDYARLRQAMGGVEEAQAYLERAVEIFDRLGAHHERERASAMLRGLSPAATSPRATAG